MSMIASDNGGTNIPKLEGGVYTAISSAIIDLGVQTNEKFGNTQRRFVMIWNIIGEEIEINGEKYPRTMMKEYSFSLSDKSTLRKDLQAWRGQAFTEEELKGFNILNILNKACQLQIIQEEKNGKSVNNIVSIMSLPKGTTIEGLKDVYHLDLENTETWNNWSKIPNWIQDKIKKANNYESSGLEKYVAEYEANSKEKEVTQSQDLGTIDTDDDLPF